MLKNKNLMPRLRQRCFSLKALQASSRSENFASWHWTGAWNGKRPLGWLGDYLKSPEMILRNTTTSCFQGVLTVFDCFLCFVCLCLFFESTKRSTSKPTGRLRRIPFQCRLSCFNFFHRVSTLAFFQRRV